VRRQNEASTVARQGVQYCRGVGLEVGHTIGDAVGHMVVGKKGAGNAVDHMVGQGL
jgi:hypothetical protein